SEGKNFLFANFAYILAFFAVKHSTSFGADGAQCSTKFFTMDTMFAFDPLTYQLFKRTENTEPQRILRNRVPLRKTQNVSSRQKIAPAFDKLRLRR
ncbi:hypothetical protein, partial [Flavobacterium sp.]|uniref:hypothetical protein n=1 Tax=Flavobacterium sp. TaxID=239 RepID=UPI002627D784